MKASRLAGLLTLGLMATGARAEIVVGVVVPRTGPVAGIGDQVLNGVNAAARDINARGGVNGEAIRLEVQDDACDPKQAVSVANRIAQGRTRLVVGHVCSGASIVASDVYAENGIVMVSPASNSAKLTERGLAGIFRVCGRDDQQGQLSAAIIAERFPGRKVAILHDGAPFGRGLADATKQSLNGRGVAEALFTGITPGERDYTAVITRLKSAGIEVVYYGGYHQEMGTLVRQAAEQAYKAQWIGTSGIATKEFAAIAGPASDGVLMTFNPDPRRHAQARAVVEAFKARGTEPEGFTLYGYTALQVIAGAADAARSPDPKRVEASLKGAPIDTILGRVGFDQKGDITAPGYVVYAWKGGTFEQEP
ncbi:Leu/Ile/Val-binding protein [Methylobacterium crusticola]|uniref:Leu/Ile/Val-binding protein n=1 Tax=Methylobacterium crusticola TaxID=1697972 RepID=A0ABQ4R6H6_9HYPH|nr:branched-chain amino acid ABC transporter substrate-binding protein [Methylobacterium crusticola]GJD53322.1 Leu/Ile/Val-binding protein [Methylobacterium crusticola]